MQSTWIGCIQGREACCKEADRLAVTLNFGGNLEEVVLDDDLSLIHIS